ncbi:MAG: beta-ketoacyl synthase N-terminal-like domain-containing protein [Thermodesulfobacteriota bacterium]
MKQVITGMGWVNSAGLGRGRRVVYRPGIPGAPVTFSSKQVFPNPMPRFGRMDRYSRLGLAGIALALQDAGLASWKELRNIAVITSTVYGCLETDADYYDTVIPEGGKLASPNLFAYTLSNTFLGEAALQFGLSGPSYVLHEEILSGLTGLHMAMEILAAGLFPAVLVGMCDTGPLPSLGLKDRSLTGALFFVLQKEGEPEGEVYGSLTKEISGPICYEGNETEDLPRLAEQCSKRFV